MGTSIEVIVAEQILSPTTNTHSRIEYEGLDPDDYRGGNRDATLQGECMKYFRISIAVSFKVQSRLLHEANS